MGEGWGEGTPPHPALSPSTLGEGSKSGRTLRLRIKLLELRVAVEAREIGIAARPVRVLVAGVPRLPQRVERFATPVDVGEGTGGVVEHGRFVGPQRHREIRLADRVVGALLLG